MSSERRLPVCSVQHPSCGACGLETRFDDGIFYCDDCGLNYGDGEDQTEAEFADEDAEPCAQACDNRWHQEGMISKDWTYDCQPCPLPAGHTSDHWTPCDMRRAA